MKRNRMTSTAEARVCKRQHRTPCHDCPFARAAVPGWLGGYTPEQYLVLAHGDVRIDCHARVGPQCAGAAVYRSNVCKRVRGLTVLTLAADRAAVFATPMEFLAHHAAAGPEE